MTGEFPAQRASNVKMFPFDDAMMLYHAGRQLTTDYSSVPGMVTIMYAPIVLVPAILKTGVGDPSATKRFDKLWPGQH